MNSLKQKLLYLSKFRGQSMPLSARLKGRVRSAVDHQIKSRVKMAVKRRIQWRKDA